MDKEIKMYTLLLLFIFESSLSYSQIDSRVCNSSFFLDIDYIGYISVYDKPSGKIIKQLRNDNDEGNYIIFNIVGKTNTMFYVNASYSLDEDSIVVKGWIKKTNSLGIYSRAYNSPLNLYKNPNRKSSIIISDRKYNPNMYNVIDCHGKWLKIKAIIKGKVYEGWIPPEMQCSNVYSTCN